MPNIEKLKAVAVFNVGDLCFTTSSGPWRVKARYWSERQQSIVYDIVFEYNGTPLSRVPEHELSTKDTRGGFRHHAPPRYSA